MINVLNQPLFRSKYLLGITTVDFKKISSFYFNFVIVDKNLQKIRKNICESRKYCDQRFAIIKSSKIADKGIQK